MKAARKAQKRNVKKSQRRKTRKAKKAQAAKRAHRSPRGKLKRAIRQLLPGSIFAGLGKHGNTKWSLGVLSFVALFWALSGETTLARIAHRVLCQCGCDGLCSAPSVVATQLEW